VEQGFAEGGYEEEARKRGAGREKTRNQVIKKKYNEARKKITAGHENASQCSPNETGKAQTRHPDRIGKT